MKELEARLTAELRRGVLQIAALALMRESTWGYRLAQDLAAHGLFTEEGTLYPILRRLEEQGLCESSWNTKGSRPRKYYQTTSQGEQTLERLLESFTDIHRALRSLVEGEQPDES